MMPMSVISLITLPHIRAKRRWIARVGSGKNRSGSGKGYVGAVSTAPRFGENFADKKKRLISQPLFVSYSVWRCAYMNSSRPMITTASTMLLVMTPFTVVSTPCLPNSALPSSAAISSTTIQPPIDKPM